MRGLDYFLGALNIFDRGLVIIFGGSKYIPGALNILSFF
jgi:hypothetical protein